MSVLIRIGLAAILMTFCSSAFSQQAQEEVDKNVARLFSAAISSRIASEVTSENGSMPAERNGIWGSYSRIGIDLSGTGFSVKTRTNVYIGGYDRDVTDSSIVGVALNAAHTNFADAKSWGISPYLAYKFTNSFFAIATYSYTNIDFTGGGGKSHSLAGSLNYVHRAGDFLFKGRAQIVGVESKVNSGGSSSKSSDIGSIGDAEAGYFFAPDVYGFAGLQAGGSKESPLTLFARLGIEKEFSKNSTASLRYETLVHDREAGGISVKVNIWTLAARFRF